MVAVGFGIKKLQINLVVEDEKVSLDDLQQEIEGDEDHVQSTDVSLLDTLNTHVTALLTMRDRSLLCRNCKVLVDVLSREPSGSWSYFLAEPGQMIEEKNEI